jgi:type I restriction enzyme S subunit
LEEHTLKPRTLLISRSGTIGPVAVFEGAEDPCVAGAYLIEFGLSESIHIEYVKGFLLSNFGQRMLKTGSRSATQANLNAPTIKRIPIPVPTFEKQKEFAVKLKEVRTSLDQQLLMLQNIENLKNSLTSEAFSGDLTAVWREPHRRELETAARTRDVALGQPTAKMTIPEITPADRPWLSQPERYWLIDQLSQRQSMVWKALQEWNGLLVPSQDLDEFRSQYFSNGHSENANDHILRALDQLAGLGLIAKINLPNQQGEYVTSYRGLREDELSQVTDL